jgi:pimeloyl-ACP methyl ester carboxylesterase
VNHSESRHHPNPTWRHVARPDAEIAYLDSGAAAPAIIFLHGLAGHAGEWLGTMRRLHPRWRTLALDQRGHGRSTRRPVNLSREAFADDVAAVIDAAALDHPVALIGQSMGAHTALVTAARFPRLVSRLVMIEGDVGGGDEAELATLRATLDAWPFPFPDYESAMRFFGGANELGRAWADGLDARADGLWPRWDADIMVQTMEPIFEREHWAEWESLPHPTLLVLGQSGWIDPRRVDRMVATRPSAQRVTVAHARHDVHIEQPQAWHHALETFLRPTD